MRNRIVLSTEVSSWLLENEIDLTEFALLLETVTEAGDQQLTNPVDGRILSISMLGSIAVTYYRENATGEIRVLDVEPVGDAKL